MSDNWISIRSVKLTLAVRFYVTSEVYFICYNYFSFIICIHKSTNAEKLVKFGLDIWYDMLIFAVSSQKVQKLPVQSMGLVDRSSPKLHIM